MIAVATSPFRPANSLAKPTWNPQFSCPVACDLDLGFGRCSGTGLYNFDLRSNQSDRMQFVRKLGFTCFAERPQKGQKVEVESVNSGGGVDVFDAASAEAEVGQRPDHLVIMVNGIVGSAEDWRYGAQQFVKKLPDKVIVHRSECNSSRLTFDGVDRMGERLADEVRDVVKRWAGLHKISFVAHSLGGLVARYAIGRLCEDFRKLGSSGLTCNLNDSSEPLKLCADAKVAGLEPMNFITVATPHLGSRGNRQLPILCGLSFLEKGASQTAHWIAGRSGMHLFLTDNDDGRPPLLLRMVNDSGDLKFMSGLRSFKRRVAYANANYDHVVGWRTSSIRRQHELPKANLLVTDKKYPHIVHVEPETADIHDKQTSMVGTLLIDLEEEMIRGLTQVPWERVDVSFQKSKQRYVAHNTIQVKNYWLNSDGADVVLHMIDNFLL